MPKEYRPELYEPRISPELNRDLWLVGISGFICFVLGFLCCAMWF